MSSSAVRTAMLTFLGTISGGIAIVDMTGKGDELDDILAGSSVDYDDAWIGVEFFAAGEAPAVVRADNDQGKYREEGNIFLHLVYPITSSAASNIVALGETINNEFRGETISGIQILRQTTANFEDAATLQFEGGFTSASIIISYRRDHSI